MVSQGSTRQYKIQVIERLVVLLPFQQYFNHGRLIMKVKWYKAHHLASAPMPEISVSAGTKFLGVIDDPLCEI